MAFTERIGFEILAEEDDESSVPLCSFQACNLCNRTMVYGEDVFMYRDGTYCSVECREEGIFRKEKKEELNLWKIEKKPQKIDPNPLDEAGAAWLEKFHSRKRFRRFDDENVKPFEDVTLAGLEFAIGADASINRARQRKIWSVNRARKYSNQRALLDGRKLKSSSEHLLSENGIRQDSSAEFLLQGRDHVINIDHRIDQDEGSSKTVQDKAEWTILLTTLALEASAAFFDQVSSPSKPYYALIALIMSLIALSICVGEIVYKAKKAKVTWRQKGRICWLYHPFPRDLPFGSLVDCFGLACAVVQCIFSVVQYSFFVRNNDNPIKFCVIPAIFALCLVFSRLIKNHAGLRYP